MPRIALTIVIAATLVWLAFGQPGHRATAEPEIGTRTELFTGSAEPEAIPGELIVHFKAGTPSIAKRSALGADVSIIRDLRLSGYSLVRVPERREAEYMGRLASSGDIITAEPNLVRRASFTPNDPIYPFQWHFPKVGKAKAWDFATGTGVTVAVIDTGVAFENCSSGVCGTQFFQAPDFAGASFVSPRDEINNDIHPNDQNGHGTHVASTIAERTNNGLGVAGIAFNASIMPVQVLDANGSGSVADGIDGIVYAADNGADVINLSLGGPGGIQAEQDAINYAYNAGVVVVAAAGNGGMDSIGDPVLDCPACYPNSISVAATRIDQTRSYYSNFGAGLKSHTLDISAPGGDVTVDQNGDTYSDGVLQQTFTHACGGGAPDYSAFVYCFFQGTSMATPHVAGIAALMLSKNSALTPAQVKQRLISTATDRGPAGYDTGYGYGVVNASRAVQAANVDSDSDGCSNTREQQAKGLAAAGGGRDPNKFWDFFDTPDQDNIRNRIISIADLLRTISRFGTNGNPGGDPLSAPPPTGYHTAFDRSAPTAGSNPWQINAPDGAITVSDIFFGVAQFGHTCVS